MAQRNEAVLDFFATRRSRPAKLLRAPAPNEAELHTLLALASRVPDHGALVPWRFIVLEAADCVQLADVIEARGATLGLEDEQIAKGHSVYRTSPMCVVVVHAIKESPKIPVSEQVLTGGVVCAALVNAALASGWGANWISGWPSYDRDILNFIGLDQTESVAGMIHIGSTDAIPPERPRPDVSDLITKGLK